MTDPSDHWLDEIDQAILDQVRTVYTRLDPPPDDLNARAQFVIALEQVEFEVARLTDEVLVGSGPRTAERTRTMTFDSDRLTIMVSFAETAAGQVRLDGWLAPPAPLQVELRVAGQAAQRADTSRETTADQGGRFVFEAVGHGLAQLLVRRASGLAAEPTASVVTPSFML